MLWNSDVPQDAHALSRAGELKARRIRRFVGLRAGASFDWLSELAFRTGRRPRGLLHRDMEITADRIEAAIRAGVAFLERRQERNGVLRGFFLYPGASTTWVTAHVAFVLEDVSRARALCERGAAYLQSIGASDGGWGYNRRVTPDCDSSAQALMVTARFELPCEPFLLRNLAAAQLPCGGFPTYVGDGSASTGWQSAHPEVSALVTEALRRAGGFDDNVDRCSQWLERSMNAGVLPAYWWDDTAYSLWVQARTCRLGSGATSAVRAGLEEHRTSPQLSMALAAAVLAGASDASVSDAASRLLGQQLSDGSWACGACLRLTDPRSFTAGPGAPGPLVADRRRVFSTAHAVAALQAVGTRLLS